MDIRSRTVVILGRGNEFLVGVCAGTHELKWSTSPWDAWETRRMDIAKMVAGVTGTELFLFNRIAGQIKKI